MDGTCDASMERIQNANRSWSMKTNATMVRMGQVMPQWRVNGTPEARHRAAIKE